MDKVMTMTRTEVTAMPDDYIKRSDALEAMMTCRSLTPIAKLEAVNHITPIPAADVAPIVRCKDCKKWEKIEYYPDGYKMCCRLLKAEMHGNCFCSFGERKEG